MKDYIHIQKISSENNLSLSKALKRNWLLILLTTAGLTYAQRYVINILIDIGVPKNLQIIILPADELISIILFTLLIITIDNTIIRKKSR